MPVRVRPPVFHRTYRTLDERSQVSDTPFTDRFSKKSPGIWWHITYIAKDTQGMEIGSQEFRFDHNPGTFTLDRVDYCLKEIQDLFPGKHILILSWSKFTVPKTPSDV